MLTFRNLAKSPIYRYNFISFSAIGQRGRFYLCSTCMCNLNYQVAFGHPENALVQFASAEKAAAAFHSPEPVLNNRFVRVFFYRPPPTNVAAQRGALIGPRGRGGHRGRGGGRHHPAHVHQEGEGPEVAEGEEIDPDALGDLKRTVNNVQAEEPKIVEEARNKQKEKRSEAVQQAVLLKLIDKKKFVTFFS